MGYYFTGLPAYNPHPICLTGGALGGAIWGFIPGWLKAKTGGHEVINTIMMNYIAFFLNDWSAPWSNAQRRNFSTNQSGYSTSAELPKLFPYPIRFHIGFFIAWRLFSLFISFLFKTTWGLNLRMVGSNPPAAKYAGINVARYTILALTFRCSGRVGRGK